MTGQREISNSASGELPLRGAAPDAERTMRWRPSRRQLLMGAAAAAVVGGLVTRRAFALALIDADHRLANRSAVIQTSFGALEYGIAGVGSSLLMIHGTGGGFDQGLRFAASIRKHGHHIIAPSRFGYLRSDFPSDPSSENQADAFVALLDHLRIDTIPVAGGSAGALSAAQFALRHPKRCSGLILLVPAANVGKRDPVEMTPLQKTLVQELVESDALYWALLDMAPKQLIGTLLATDPALLDQVSDTERRRAYAILDDMLPIRRRSRGMLNDGRLAGHPARIDFDRIKVPTLIISAEDDRFGTANTAHALAKMIPGAELTIYPSGGHIWLGHDQDVANRMHQFLTKLRRRKEQYVSRLL